MCSVMSKGNSAAHETVEILDSGHAAHLENPLSVITAVRLFVTREKVRFGIQDYEPVDTLEHMIST